MMVAVFATLLLAFLCGWFGRRWMAVACFVASMLLAAGLFLWEIYDPTYGFRMPWLQTEAPAAWTNAGGAGS
jgi:hypothetical protein